MDSILVTGGAGFIGSCFTREWFREASSPLVVLDKLTYAANLDSLAPVRDDPRLTFCEGDIGDYRLVAALLAEHRPRAIVNFAAESHVDRSIDAPAPFVMTNVVGTFQLLEAAREYWCGLPEPERSRFRFLHVSTDEVYGSLGAAGKFSETTPYAPSSPYAASKASADHFARACHRTHGLPVLVTNCSNNYGPCQFPEKLIPLMILNAFEGQALPVYGDGMHVRDWLAVEDHCRALRLILENGNVGEQYNVGGDCERTNLDVVRTICGIVDRLEPDLPGGPAAGRICFVEDRPGHDRRYAIDATKIRETLGWRPEVDFETGLGRTVRWYRENPEWVRSVADGSYRRERQGRGVMSDE